MTGIRIIWYFRARKGQKISINRKDVSRFILKHADVKVTEAAEKTGRNVR